MGALSFIKDVFQSITQWFTGFEEEPQGVLVNKRSTNRPVPVAYGESMITAANIDFVETSGTDNRYLFIAASFCEGEIDDFTEIFLDDKPLSEYPSPNVSTYPNLAPNVGDDVVVVHKYLGTDDQLADPMLQTQAKWTANHRFQGIAYLAIRLRYKEKYFTGVPQITAVGRWKKVRDYRITPPGGAVAWSNNHALIYRDYLQATRYGRGLLDAAFDPTSWNDAADQCDVITTLVTPQNLGQATEALSVGDQNYLRWDNKPSEAFAYGGSQLIAAGKQALAGSAFMSSGWFGNPGGFYLPFDTVSGADLDVADVISNQADNSLYECNIKLNTGDSDETVFRNAERIRAEMRAFVSRLGDGKYYIKLDQSYAAVDTITPDDIVGGFDWTAPGKDDMYNRVTAKFTNPNLNWKEDRAIYPAPGSATETALLAEDNGALLHKEISLTGVTNVYQATEIARLMLYKSRNSIACSFTCLPRLIARTVGDVIELDWPSLGWNQKEFQIMQMGLADNGLVFLSLVEYSTLIFEYESVPLDLLRNNTDLPDPFNVQVPQNVAVESLGDILDDLEPRQINLYLDVTWDRMLDDTVSKYEVRQRVIDPPPVRPFESVVVDQVAESEIEVQAYIQVPLWLRTYEVQVRAINDLGVAGDWSAPVNHPLVFDTDPPDPPVLVSAIGGTNSITVDFTPPAAPDYAYARVSIALLDVQPASARIGEQYGTQAILTDLSPGVTYYMWLESVDDTGNIGPASPSFTAITLAQDGPVVYPQPTEPPGNGYNIGDIWENTTPPPDPLSGQLKEWDGDSWELHTPPDPQNARLANRFRGNDSIFIGNSAIVLWDAAPLSVYNYDVEVWGQWGTDPQPVIKRKVVSRNTEDLFAGRAFQYKYSDAIDDDANTADGVDRIQAGARTFTVRAYTMAPDNVTRSVNYTEVTVTNPQDQVPVDLTVTVDDRSVNISHTMPEGKDFAGLEIHASDTSGYTPGPGTLLRTVYARAGTEEVRAFMVADTDYYIRVGAFDNWGKDAIQYEPEIFIHTPVDFQGLAYKSSVGSGEIDAGAVVNSKLGPNAVTGAKIANDAVTRPKVVQGELVETHAVLSLAGAFKDNVVDNDTIVPLTYNFTAEADGLILFSFYGDCSISNFQANTWGDAPVIVAIFEIGVDTGTYLANTSMYLPMVMTGMDLPVGTTDWRGFVSIQGTSEWSGFPTLSGGESITVKPKFFYYSVDGLTGADQFQIANCQAVIEELNNT